MSAKEMIITFIIDAFTIALIGFCIVYFTAGDRLAMFYKFMQALFPIVLFTIFFLVRVRVSREQVRKFTREKNLDIILHLTYLDKLISDVLIYLLPILILGVAIIINKQITLVDVFQAVIAFLLMYFWQRMIFKKE